MHCGTYSIMSRYWHTYKVFITGNFTTNYSYYTFFSPLSHKNVDHSCDQTGCGQVLIVDCNMKNHRDVCLATDAGFAEFNGLQGKVKTGCPNTPQPKSRYCPSHTPTTFTPQGENSSTQTTVESGPAKKSPTEEQIAFISGKRVTRHTTFYQVRY